MLTPFTAAPGIDVVPSAAHLPNLGSLVVNAFVLHGAEPVLVDAGIVSERDDFIDALRTVIDPTDLRWLWLTHTDFDHIGAISALLAENPHLRVITSFGGVGIMGLFDPLPMDRVYLINPGETLVLADRTLTAFRPPSFDNPITAGFHDDRTNALFSSDCFGALLAELPEDAAELSEAELRLGQVLWTSIDSPWLHKVNPEILARDLEHIRGIQPSMILSSHLPPAPGRMLDLFLGSIAEVPASDPFVGPDQGALEQMLAAMASMSAEGSPPSTEPTSNAQGVLGSPADDLPGW